MKEVDWEKRRLLKEVGETGFKLWAAWQLRGLIPLGVNPQEFNGQTSQFPEREENLFTNLIAIFSEEAKKRRFERAQTDPEFSRRVEPELNENRVNFLLFSWGWTFEPPFVYPAVIGSQTIFSYDGKRRMVDLVSLTHDIRAPEIEKYLVDQGAPQRRAILIWRAYFTPGGGEAGFNFMGQILERATGLAVDFQLAFEEDLLADFIKTCLGNKIRVKVPKSFRINPTYFQNERYPEQEFLEGEQELSGLQALQFIKGVVMEAKPDRALEHNVRKPLVVKGILNSVKSNLVNPFFWLQTNAFLDKAVRDRKIAVDFDIHQLLLSNLNQLPSIGWNSLVSLFDSSEESLMPEIGKNIYIVDITQGDGGVRWAKGDLHHITRQDWEGGVYLDPNTEVPYGADPYAEDLIKDYWKSIRETVKRHLKS